MNAYNKYILKFGKEFEKETSQLPVKSSFKGEQVVTLDYVRWLEACLLDLKK